MADEISTGTTQVTASSNNQEKEPVVVSLCHEAAQKAQDAVASLSATVIVDIPAPVTNVGETSPTQMEEKEVKGTCIVFGTDEAVDDTKIEALPEACEVVVINDDDDKANQGESEALTDATDAGGSPNGRISDEQHDIDVGDVHDAPMIDAAAAEVIPTKAMQSDKEFPAPAGLENVEADDFMTLGGAPWFDIEALSVEGFVD